MIKADQSLEWVVEQHIQDKKMANTKLFEAKEKKFETPGPGYYEKPT